MNEYINIALILNIIYALGFIIYLIRMNGKKTPNNRSLFFNIEHPVMPFSIYGRLFNIPHILLGFACSLFITLSVFLNSSYGVLVGILLLAAQSLYLTYLMIIKEKHICLGCIFLNNGFWIILILSFYYF